MAEAAIRQQLCSKSREQPLQVRTGWETLREETDLRGSEKISAIHTTTATNEKKNGNYVLQKKVIKKNSTEKNS